MALGCMTFGRTIHRSPNRGHLLAQGLPGVVLRASAGGQLSRFWGCRCGLAIPNRDMVGSWPAAPREAGFEPRTHRLRHTDPWEGHGPGNGRHPLRRGTRLRPTGAAPRVNVDPFATVPPSSQVLDRPSVDRTPVHRLPGEDARPGVYDEQSGEYNGECSGHGPSSGIHCPGGRPGDGGRRARRARRRTTEPRARRGRNRIMYGEHLRVNRSGVGPESLGLFSPSNTPSGFRASVDLLPVRTAYRK